MMRNIIISMLLCLMVTVANADVIAHWSFNDQADPWHDDSGNGHDGTTPLPLGVPQWNEGGTVTFDGIDDFIDMGFFSFAGDESFEVEVRFKNPSISVGEAILGYNVGGGHTVDPGGVFMIVQDSDRMVSEVMDDVYTDGWNFSRVESINGYFGDDWYIAKVKRDVSSDTFSLEIRNDSGILCEPIISTEDLTTPTDNITLNNFAVGCQYVEAKTNGYWDGFSGTIDYVTITSEPVVVGVSIDIKPGSCPNPLRVNFLGKGVFSVAIVGGDPDEGGFDVSSVDVATITLHGVSPIRSNYEDVSTPSEGEGCECNSEGPDGIDDLVLKFDRQAIIAALEVTYGGDLTALPNREELPLTLTAMLIDEEVELEGTDCFRILNRGAIKRKK